MSSQNLQPFQVAGSSLEQPVEMRTRNPQDNSVEAAILCAGQRNLGVIILVSRIEWPSGLPLIEDIGKPVLEPELSCDPGSVGRNSDAKGIEANCRAGSKLLGRVLRRSVYNRVQGDRKGGRLQTATIPSAHSCACNHLLRRREGEFFFSGSIHHR